MAHRLSVGPGAQYHGLGKCQETEQSALEAYSFQQWKDFENRIKCGNVRSDYRMGHSVYTSKLTRPWRRINILRK